MEKKKNFGPKKNEIFGNFIKISNLTSRKFRSGSVGHISVSTAHEKQPPNGSESKHSLISHVNLFFFHTNISSRNTRVSHMLWNFFFSNFSKKSRKIVVLEIFVLLNFKNDVFQHFEIILTGSEVRYLSF